jgi:hypothetical protein
LASAAGAIAVAASKLRLMRRQRRLRKLDELGAHFLLGHLEAGRN